MFRQLIGSLVDRHYIKKGYEPESGKEWILAAKNAFKNSDLPVGKRLWALRRGFYPYRIEQYALTEENYHELLSDRDYKRLYPINNRYKKWIDDKLTMKYMLKPFDEFMSKYYFHIMSSRACKVMRLMDCPLDIPSGFSGILELLKLKSALAIKPTGGTYGIGFCKLSYEEGKFFINGKENSAEEMLEFFKTAQDHIIIEYIKMHKDIARMNPDSLNTVRVMLINENGDNPIIPSAFMRIGTKSSGFVDNTAQGGMFCKIDVETGRYFDGEKINKHIITPAKNHPDTGELVEGILPNWDLVKTKLIEIADYMPQLEWMGFDIAITENGFNIVEINTHQGLHRYHTYPQLIKDYFNRKLINKN